MEKPKQQKKPEREATFMGWMFIFAGFGAVYIYGTDTPVYAPAHGAIVGGFIMILLGKLSKQVAQLQEQVNKLKSETESSASESA
jgi:hypothetical protein